MNNKENEGLDLDEDLDDTSAQEPRSADFGESGQHAPGGYYNQRGATKPDRLDLDEDLARNNK